MRVVLYAEGPNEAGVEGPPSYDRRRPLPDEELGPAHVLSRRAIARATGRDPRSIRFEPPLLHLGRAAVGSQILDGKVLPRLLTWADPAQAPELAIVLVDGDGEKKRRSTLQAVVERRGSFMPVVVAVAVQEFEAWLLVDVKLWNELVEHVVDHPGNPESWNAGDAKERWTSLVSDSKRGQHMTRLRLAAEMDLDVVERTCASFRQFLEDLREAHARIP